MKKWAIKESTKYLNISKIDFIGLEWRICHICQVSKSDNIKYVGECKSIVTKQVGDIVMADLYGPLHSYILVIQDSFSKFVKLYDLTKASSRAVVWLHAKIK